MEGSVQLRSQKKVTFADVVYGPLISEISEITNIFITIKPIKLLQLSLRLVRLQNSFISTIKLINC